MFAVEIQFGDTWVVMPQRYDTNDAAHWACTEWRVKFTVPTKTTQHFMRVVKVSDRY